MHRLAGFIAAALVAVVATGPTRADEFTDVVEGALKAYREGDVAGAIDELEYAMELLGDVKAESLAGFLPEAAEGWTKEAAEAGGTGMAMAMFGGGTAAAATYRRGAEEFTLTLVANSPMVSGIAAMLSGISSISGTETRRINRTSFAMQDGELQGVVGGKVLISASGSASPDDMAAAIERIDFRKLEAF